MNTIKLRQQLGGQTYSQLTDQVYSQLRWPQDYQIYWLHYHIEEGTCVLRS